MYDMKPRPLHKQLVPRKEAFKKIKDQKTAKAMQDKPRKCLVDGCEGDLFGKRGYCYEHHKEVFGPSFCKCGNTKNPSSSHCKTCLRGPKHKVQARKANKKKKNKPAKKGKRKNRFKFSLSGIDLKPYSDRNEICRDLGFKSYEDYTKGKLWKSIRLRVFQSQGRVCQFCKKSANQIHHSKYTKGNLSGESLRHLHPICGDCHQSAEFDEQGNKRTLDKCNEILGISPA